MNEKATWELVSRDSDRSERTERLAVPGGWIYRSIVLGYHSGEPSVALVLVPDSKPATDAAPIKVGPCDCVGRCYPECSGIGPAKTSGVSE